MMTRISSDGRITIPVELRREGGIEPGDVFEVERIERGTYHLTRRDSEVNEGLVDLLLACPVKGWFKPLD
jgi:AbrB family looped-hinge helix DNA binding protein